MKNKVYEVIKFYNMATSLKNVLRTGWLQWHVKSERIESVAEHIYGTMILAIAIESEFDSDIDLNKVLKMLLIHELEEIIIGDITPYQDVSNEEKLKMGVDAVNKVLDGFTKKEEYISLTNEFNEHITKESLFAFMCDKLEADIQAKKYSLNEDVDIYSDENMDLFNDERIQNMLKNGACDMGDLFIEHSKHCFKGEFLDIVNYVKNGDIL